MYGEKAEQCEELKMDLEDVKSMYKSQVKRSLLSYATSLPRYLSDSGLGRGWIVWRVVCFHLLAISRLLLVTHPLHITVSGPISPFTGYVVVPCRTLFPSILRCFDTIFEVPYFTFSSQLLGSIFRYRSM